MITNPFAPNIQYENDMDDFKMPYRMYGKTDLEIMIMRYKRLSNSTHGLVMRLKTGW